MFKIQVFSTEYPKGVCPVLGAPYEGSVTAYYVVAVGKDGQVWHHRHEFFEDELGLAEAGLAADKLAARITAAQATGRWGGPANSPHWYRHPGREE